MTITPPPDRADDAGAPHLVLRLAASTPTLGRIAELLGLAFTPTGGQR